MNSRRLMTVSFVLIPVLALAWGPVWAGLGAQETPLAPTGLAYELNLDSQGSLWVSDLNAKEIRSYDQASGAYTAYKVGGAPSDAHSDGKGSVWWADSTSNKLGRLSTSANQATIWAIPGSTGLYSTAVDSTGPIWVSDYNLSLIYRLNPVTNQLCTYTLPDYGTSEYLLIAGQTLWFGDTLNARIVRLQGNTFNWWALPEGSYPRDLELDGDGRLWWTDANKGYLGRLDTGAATITTFTPPASGQPWMLSLSGGMVWYSQQTPSRVVVLDPAAASQTAPVTTGSKAAAPTCTTLSPLAPTAVTVTSGQASWTDKTYSTVLDEAGWKMDALPAGSAPWGIVATADKIWVVDQGRRVLAKFSPVAPTPPSTNVYLPLVQRQ